MFPESGHIDSQGFPTSKWYAFREYGYNKDRADRHPKGSMGRASSSMYRNWIMNYLDSRMYVYCKGYAYLVKKTEVFWKLRNLVSQGQKFLILDHDIKAGGAYLITKEFLRERVYDTSLPFGHGYVLAGLLVGLEPEDYCLPLHTS